MNDFHFIHKIKYLKDSVLVVRRRLVTTSCSILFRFTSKYLNFLVLFKI